MDQRTQPPRLWDIIERAMAESDATALHLSVGRPPMIRIGDEGLHPLPGDHPLMTWKSIQIMLSPMVEPERWDAMEQSGDGEILLTHSTGKRIRMNLFRTSSAWSVVVHL